MQKQKTIYPKALKPGNKVGVIAPSRSLDIVQPATRCFIEGLFKTLELDVVYLPHACAGDGRQSSFRERLDDLHSAFSDASIDAIICAMGGYHINDLLPYIDWDMIRKNPKTFMGFSDITVFLNAMFSKTGIVTYHGPNFGSFGMKKGGEYQIESFKNVLMRDDAYEISVSPVWSDDEWYLDQENRHFHVNPGPVVLREGQATGTALGGNLSSLALLQGTPYMPVAHEIILCLEEDALAGAASESMFVRGLRSLLQQENFGRVAAICIGRFPQAAHVQLDSLLRRIQEMPLDNGIPVIANIDFGHTYPSAIIPIGGKMEVSTKSGATRFLCRKEQQ